MALPLLPVISACARNGVKDLIGTPVPELVLPDFMGRTKNFRDYSGKAMLINIWATWCHPCRAEMAGLDRLYRSLNAEGLQLLGVSVDEDLNLVQEYVRQSGISFPILSDPKGQKTSAVLGTSAVPVSLLVGRDGRIRRVVTGERVWDEGEALAWVTELLN